MTEVAKTPTPAESQLQVAIGRLLEILADRSAAVVDTAVLSIRKLASKHPNQVLDSCCQCCKRLNKAGAANNQHIASILTVIESVCTDHLIEIDGDTILSTIDFSLMIMIDSAGYEPLVQMPASGVLVALGRKHYIQVMEILLKKLEVDVVPHYMIPHTLGALASANAYGVIPYLKNILANMLPLFGGLKSDPLKQAFCYALGSFCDALIEYVSNIEQVPDNTITIEQYQTEIGMAYDILFGSWLHSREIKLIESVLSAITSVYPVLSVEKVTQQTMRIVPVLLNFYRKQHQIDSYHITKCLGSVIQKAANVNGTLLEPLLTQILQHIAEIVCISPDYAQQPDLLRSHSEVLRCYECFALHFTDHTIDQLINQLRNNNDRERIRALLVITHLISYSTEQTVQRRFKDIIKQLNELLNDSNVKVKKALLKIIVAFASRGVFFDKEVNPDGPDKYMEFILKLCCKQGISKNNNEISNNQELLDIQKSADNTLCMLSTSVPELESTLWQLLIESFLGQHYDDAIIVLLRCLTHLALKREQTDHCEGAFIRCLSLLAIPLPAFRGTYVLNFLKNIRFYHGGDGDGNMKCKVVWESKITQLIKYLEQNYDHFNQIEWQDLVFDFLTILLENIKDDQSFNERLVLAARKQFDMYNNFNNKQIGSVPGDLTIKQNEKHFLLKCLSMILCHIKDKEIVLQTLDNILVNVKLTDYNELDACSEAIGITSRVHLELVLDKLSIIRKDILLKKSSKFFQFMLMKDQKHDIGIERIRYVVVASYSEICKEATTDKLLKVIESEILDFIVNELIVNNNCKDSIAIRRICLKAIGSVADAMHPNRNSLHIRMLDRDKVLDEVASQIRLHSGPEFIELFPVIIPVITSLVRLPLPLDFEQRFKLLKLSFDSVFNAAAIYCKITATTDGSSSVSDTSNSYYGDLKLVPFVTGSFTKLNHLVQEILLQNLSATTLDEIVVLLEVWLGMKRAEQRLPAIETLRIVLQTYLDNMKFAYDCPTNNQFGQTGSLLAQIVPRCTDPNKNIRKVSVECLCLVLCISSRYEGQMREHDKQLSNALQHIQQQIDSDEPKLLYNLTSDLAHIICANLPHFQLLHFVDSLISNALLDCETSSSSGSSVVLNITLKNKGGELQIHVITLMEKICTQLTKIKCPRTRLSTLRAVLSFATHHSQTIGHFLMAQPLPFDESICDCWSILSTDSTLVLDLLDQIKKIMKQSALYEVQGNDGEIKVATLQPLQAISVLHELFKNQQLKGMLQQQFPELFTILLVTLASYIGTASPAINKNTNEKKKEYYGLMILNRDAVKLKPAKIALETFKLFLLGCQYNQIVNCLLSFTHIDSDEELPIFLDDVVSNLVEMICIETPQSLSWLVATLGPYIRTDFERQRVVVVAFFVYLLKHYNKIIDHQLSSTSVLAENLLEMILDCQMDQSCCVRKIALQGIGFAADSLNPDLISRHCKPILSVLMNSLDYNNIGHESDVILQGMISFSKLLATLDGYKFSTCQVTAAVRIKPLLDHQDDVQLRCASFRLLGDLALSLGSDDANVDAFKEQVQGNLITLLLHLCDPDFNVIKACKYTLRGVSSYLDSPKVNAMIQEHLIDEANLHYSNFIKDLIKVMAEELQDLFNLLVMTSLSYLKSPWVEIRSNAAFMAGLLYSYLHNESKQRGGILLDTVCDKLMRLLNDEQDEVRLRAAEAIAYLFVN